MDDLISRQAAIDALWKALYEYEDKTEKQFIDSEELDVADWVQHRNFVQNMSDIDRQTILSLPLAQPERTETHACDLIDRQAAIESVADEIWHYPNECYKNLNVFENAKDLAEHALRGLPSAEPERKKGNEKCSNELPCGWCSLFDTPCFGRGGEQDG